MRPAQTPMAGLHDRRTLLVVHEQATHAARDFSGAMAHPRIDAAGDRLVRAPYPEPARLGDQSMSHCAAIGFREVMEHDAAACVPAFGDGTAAVEQLRIPYEYVSLAGLEQFALQSLLLDLRTHPALPRAQFLRKEMALAIGENVRLDPMAAGPVAQQARLRRAILQRHPHRDEVGGCARSHRSEERRVGKECRSRWAAYD